MGERVKSFQFRAPVLKSKLFMWCRTKVLYRLYHWSVQRQGVMEHDCSQSAMTAQASTSCKKRENYTPGYSKSVTQIVRVDTNKHYMALKYPCKPPPLCLICCRHPFFPLLEDKSIISPSFHTESNAPSSWHHSPSNFFFFHSYSLLSLWSSQGDHKICVIAVSLFKTNFKYLPKNVLLKWNGAHCTVIKQILETIGFFTAFFVYCFYWYSLLKYHPFHHPWKKQTTQTWKSLGVWGWKMLFCSMVPVLSQRSDGFSIPGNAHG